MNIHAQADVANRQPHSDFERLPIGGEWRQGKMRALRDIDPYTDEVLLEIPQADRGDLDDLYAAAARAQTTLAQLPASARGEVLRGAAHVMEMRRDEIVCWLIHESGSTRLKANLGWASSHAVMLWAASAASQLNGRLLPTGLYNLEYRGIEYDLRKDNVCAIPRASHPAHVRENRVALDMHLSASDFAELDHAFPPPTQKRPLAVH